MFMLNQIEPGPFGLGPFGLRTNTMPCSGRQAAARPPAGCGGCLRSSSAAEATVPAKISAPTGCAFPHARENRPECVPQFASSDRRRKQIPYRNDRASGLVQQGLSVAEALLVNIGLAARQINAIR